MKQMLYKYCFGFFNWAHCLFVCIALVLLLEIGRRAWHTDEVFYHRVTPLVAALLFCFN
jgi:hypothetical protein